VDADSVRASTPSKRRLAASGAKKLHPNYRERYTPISDQVIALLEQMRDELGFWRDVSAVSGTRLKVLRSIRHRKHANGKDRKTISLTLLDRLITTTGVGNLRDFTFFTPEDLIKMGIWEDVDQVDITTDIRWEENRRSPFSKSGN